MQFDIEGDADFRLEEFINENMVKELYQGVVKVTFLKKDKTVREMVCTLMEDYLPEKEKEVIVESQYTLWQPTDKLGKAQDAWKAEPEPEEKPKAKESVAVWDLEKNAWRSFRFDSVISFQTGVDYATQSH